VGGAMASLEWRAATFGAAGAEMAKRVCFYRSLDGKLMGRFPFRKRFPVGPGILEQPNSSVPVFSEPQGVFFLPPTMLFPPMAKEFLALVAWAGPRETARLVVGDH